MMTANTGEAERARWIANPRNCHARAHLRCRRPQKVDTDNEPKIIGEAQHYLRDFSEIVAEESTAAVIVANMVERYPNGRNLRTLLASARSATARDNAERS